MKKKKLNDMSEREKIGMMNECASVLQKKISEHTVDKVAFTVVVIGRDGKYQSVSSNCDPAIAAGALMQVSTDLATGRSAQL